MTMWAVTVTIAGSPSESALIDLEDRFPEDYFVAAIPTRNQFAVTGTIESPEWMKASDVVVHCVESVIGPAEIVGVEVLDRDEYDRRADEPTMPEVVSAPEVASILGVTRQRVHQLSSDNRHFPPPLFRLGSGPIWSVEAIRSFDSKWPRKPGRPKLESDSDDNETMSVAEAAEA
jgi:predicted DNA-binding transcriptional regulator AlpA